EAFVLGRKGGSISNSGRWGCLKSDFGRARRLRWCPAKGILCAALEQLFLVGERLTATQVTAFRLRPALDSAQSEFFAFRPGPNCLFYPTRPCVSEVLVACWEISGPMTDRLVAITWSVRARIITPKKANRLKRARQAKANVSGRNKRKRIGLAPLNAQSPTVG